MTVVVAHSTAADGTFSATGAVAWDANHTLTGVGTMAEQNANNVAITGGTINGATVGATTAAAITGTTITATTFSGAGTSLTGTASGLTAGNVTTNANLTGGVTSVGNAATVVTNANLTGAVTSVGNATTMNSALDSLTDVVIATPVVDQILKYNGTDWVNGASNSISGGAGIEFFNATPQITASGTNSAIAIFTLSQTPITTAQQTTTITSIIGTVAGAAWLSPALGRTTLDAGTWDFTVYPSVSSVGGATTTLARQMYAALPLVTGTVTTTGAGTSRTATASAGTPFATTAIVASATNTLASYLQTPQGLYQITARTSDTVVTISTLTTYVNEAAVAGSVWKLLFTSGQTPNLTTTPTQYDLVTTQSAFTVTALTKLGGISFVTSTNAGRIVSIPYNGTLRNTHIASPLAVLHNQLGGLQGGAADEQYHSTLAEYTGSGTGVFARVASPTFTGTVTCATLVATVGISGGAF